MKGKSQVEERLAEVQRLLRELEPETRHHGNNVIRLSDELEVKVQLFYAVIVSGHRPLDTVKVVNETWAGALPEQDIAFFVQREREENGVLSEAHLSPSVHPLPSSRPAEVTVLEYICQNKLNSSKWFFIANSDLYVKTDSIESYLREFDALQYHYGYLGKPVKRDPIGRVCMPGPGSLLSHVTMEEVCTKIEGCGKLEPLTDSVLGECLHRLVPRLQCNKEGRPHELFLKFDGGKRGPITELKHRDILDKALTVYPVSDPKLMYSLHQLTVAERLNASQHQLQEIKSSLDQMEELLPHVNVLARQEEGEAVTSREDVATWKLINGNLLMSEEESDPATKLPTVWKSELDSLVKKVVDYLSSWEEGSYKFKRIVNGYFRVLPQTGIDYIIDFEGKEVRSDDELSPAAKHFRVSLSRWFDSLQVDPVLLKAADVKSRHVTIAVVMTTDHSKQFQGFMTTLEKVLKDDQKINLLVVRMKAEERNKEKTTVVDVKTVISLLETKYPQASFAIVDSPSLLSREHGLSLAIRELRPNDIVFLADLNLEFDSGFLDRCVSLPLQGQQAYYPVVFSKADPSLLTTINSVETESTISAQSGHWLSQSRGVACLYAADILTALQQAVAKGIANSVDVTAMYRSLVEKGYEVVMATDKGLTLSYDEERECLSQLVGEECDSERQDYLDLCTRMQLSVLLFDHEGADKF